MWRFVTERDLGHSVANRDPVSERIMTAAPVTLSLIFGGMVVWMLVAIPLGILSALRPRSKPRPISCSATSASPSGRTT